MPTLGRNAPFRGFKDSLWEGGIRMPAMARLPGVIPAGSTTSQTALSIDWLPTILSAAGIPAPPGKLVDGVDLWPVLRGERPVFQRTLFWRFKRLQARRKAVRSGDWKYISDSGREELHDLASDPAEPRDLLKERGEIAADLKQKLAAWELDVRAPRLKDFPG